MAPKTEAGILSTIRVNSEEFMIFFLHRPIVTSHTFQLNLMNVKQNMPQASQCLCKVGAQKAPPPLEGSLEAIINRVRAY